MNEFCTCDRFALVEALDCPIHGNPEVQELFARALRAAVVENVHRQGLITDEEAEEILAGPLTGTKSGNIEEEGTDEAEGVRA